MASTRATVPVAARTHMTQYPPTDPIILKGLEGLRPEETMDLEKQLQDAMHRRDRRAVYRYMGLLWQVMHPHEPPDLTGIRVLARVMAYDLYGWEIQAEEQRT
jgi:hypothetical protein